MREHSEALAPPRALWVPFMLGRPFGVPNDAAFQRKVVLAALQLLERESGPVLENFLQDAPRQELTPAPDDLVCPVSFPRMKAEGTLAEKLEDEVAQLQAWHAVASGHRSRTTLGVTGLPVSAIAHYLSTWLTATPPPYRADISPGEALKHACDELKAFYYEAKSVQPGTHGSESLQHWFWLETAGGAVVREIRRIAAASTEPSIKAVAVQSLIPRAVEMMLARAV